MDNIAQILKILSMQNNEENKEVNIPKEIIDQYPYGEFPIRYTRNGQEVIRKNSEARYAAPLNTNSDKQEQQPQQQSNLDISTILTLSSLLSNKKKNQNDMLELFSSILFKDNPELKKILGLFNKCNKTQDINNCSNFPETNRVSISSLKKVE